MCGICGTVRFDGQPADPHRLQQACIALRHRGPDAAGTWSDDTAGVGLAATRLAVLDPSTASNQPMHRQAGRFHLVFNGEIYNFRSLRRELLQAGDEFLTDGDTEVVLAACARWGTGALDRFNGMWALAFYDSQTRTGFLSRDRLGIKPLFYSTGSQGLSFASELPALKALGTCDADVDPRALAQHLLFGYVAAPGTIYQRVRRLEPGHYLSFGDSSSQPPIGYYDWSTVTPMEHGMDYADACAEVRRLLGEAVIARRVSDVPIGAFLSGGVDSSIIVGHLALATGRPIQTFSVGYEGQRAYNETQYARIVAERFGTRHHELVLTQGDVLEAIPRILDHLDEPVGDSSIIPTALLSEFARRSVTVALSGDGGDELFGGYWRYLGHDALSAYLRLPSFLRRRVFEPLLDAVGSSKSSAIGNRVRQFRKLLRTRRTDPIACHVAWSRILAPRSEMLFSDREQAEMCETATIDLANKLTADCIKSDSLSRVLTFDLRHQLPADMLQKVDLASMMHSLEVRVPFLDHRLVELVRALPSEFKVYRGLRKRILADAYRGRLPDVVLDRAKQGFEVPIGEFLRGPMGDLFRDTVTRQTIESFGVLSYDAVCQIYDEHLTRRAEHADVLFALLSLCWWRRRERQRP